MARASKGNGGGGEPLLTRSAIVKDIGEVAYSSSMDYRRTSPQHGSSELFIAVHNPERSACSSAVVICIDHTFHCVQDYVQLYQTAQSSCCAVLDKSASGKHSLFVASVDLGDVGHKGHARRETHTRVQLVAETAPATSLELSKDKKRIYLLDSLKESAEVRCTTSWELLSSGPIKRA